MATRVHIGGKDLRGELAAYAKRFDLLEVRGVDAANLKQAPNAATLRKWRKAVPPQFEFAVVAGPNVGKLKAGGALETELAAMLTTATTLESRLVVIPTPADMTPSKLWRDRFAALLERLPRDATAVVWEPSGLWELEDAAVQAKKWASCSLSIPRVTSFRSGPSRLVVFVRSAERVRTAQRRSNVLRRLSASDAMRTSSSRRKAR
jgi:uncharacterized protein YecE (DUF72 family)